MTHFLSMMVSGVFAVIAYELVGRWYGKRTAKDVQAGTRRGRRASDQRWPHGEEISE